MNISLENAKNASMTCTVDGRFLHSKYNPENEAQNFVRSISCDYSPSCIIFSGACLPYCVPFLKERFPLVPLVSVQYDIFFLDTAIANEINTWDYSFLCSKHMGCEVLCESIYANLGEMVLSSSLIVSWNAADEVFSVESEIAWGAYRLLIQKTRDVLATRAFFSFRWLKNTVSFSLYTKNFATMPTQDVPVFLVASGYSLQSALPFIKKNQSGVCIIALSSALSALIEYGIIPDMCIATDGGFYAKNHLEILSILNRKGINIPLAIASEGNVSKEILENNYIIPLTYGDGVESHVLQECSIPAIHAERNGTVSGTAATYALSLTNKEVYAFGLDLCVGNAYTHAQPNAHELIHRCNDNRLSPLSHRIATDSLKHSQKTSSALSLYRQWFETRDATFASRFLRVVPEQNTFVKALGNIRDICVSEITLSLPQGLKKHFEINSSVLSQDKRKKIIVDIISKQRDNPFEIWIEALALPELLKLKKHPTSVENADMVHKKVQERLEILQELYT